MNTASLYYLFNHVAQATVNCQPIGGASACNSGSANTGLPQVQLSNGNVHTAFMLAFGIIGAVAVIFMMIAGIRLITSGGNPDAMADARRTIIFSAIGLTVAVSAELIIDFVLGKL